MTQKAVNFNSKEFEDFKTEMVKILMISDFEVEFVISNFEEFQQGKWKPTLE